MFIHPNNRDNDKEKFIAQTPRLLVHHVLKKGAHYNIDNLGHTLSWKKNVCKNVSYPISSISFELLLLRNLSMGPRTCL